MKKLKVLISGAGIAGPALALWLNRYGCVVTVVEKAPALRLGGQAVDFKGAVHRQVLQRMEILDEVYRRRTEPVDQTVIDADGRRRSVIPGAFTGGDVEIRRGDLAQLLYERTADDCEYVFGDWITALDDRPDGVHVTFRHGEARTFDLVVGADGVHSNVRRLAFGPEPDFVTHRGYYYALARLGGSLAGLGLTGDAVTYNEPGRMVSLGGVKAQALFVFASPQLTYDRDSTEQQKRILMDAYQGGGWRIPEVMRLVPESTEFFLDAVCQVKVDSFAKGRVVLLGDAASANTLGGFGSGLAIVGAYVLAGELMLAGGDHEVALRAFEANFRSLTKVQEHAGAGGFLAPKSRTGIALRNFTFNSRLMYWSMMKMTDMFATGIKLKDYEQHVSTRGVQCHAPGDR